MNPKLIKPLYYKIIQDTAPITKGTNQIILGVTLEVL